MSAAAASNQVFQELQVQQLIGAFRYGNDIEVYLRKFEEKTTQLNWNPERKINNLKFLFDDEVNRLIHENGNRPYEEIIRMIKETIIRKQHGDHTTILSKRFDPDLDDPAAFLRSKFIVFGQRTEWTQEERKMWLNATLPEDFEIVDVDQTRLIERLQIYVKNHKARQYEIKKLDETMKTLKDEIAKGNQLTLNKLNALYTDGHQQQQNRFNQGQYGRSNENRGQYGRPNNRGQYGNRGQNDYNSARSNDQNRGRYGDRHQPYQRYHQVAYDYSTGSRDCWICSLLNRGKPGQPSRTGHRPSQCFYRFEAAYEKGIDLHATDLDKPQRPRDNNQAAPPVNSLNTLDASDRPEVPLNLALHGKPFYLLLLFCKIDSIHAIAGIYDSGATRSVADLTTAKQLKLRLTPINEPVSGVCGRDVCKYLATFDLTIGQQTRTVHFLILNANFGNKLLIGLDTIHAFNLSQTKDLKIFQNDNFELTLIKPPLFNQTEFINALTQVHAIINPINLTKPSDPIETPEYPETTTDQQPMDVDPETPTFCDFSKPFYPLSAKSNIPLFDVSEFISRKLDSTHLEDTTPHTQTPFTLYNLTGYSDDYQLPKIDLDFRKQINPELPVEYIDRIEKILKEADCFARDEFDVGLIKGDLYSIPLKPNTLPVYRRPYYTNHEDHIFLNRTLKILLERGIVRHSFSNFAAPVVLARKKDTPSKRLTIDFRELNDITEELKFPFPTIQEMIDSVGNKAYMSTLDMNNAFWHFPMQEEDIHKTAFRTSDYHLEFTRMPQGHKNAPAVMQRGLQRIIVKHDLTEFCKNFFDDINVHSDNLDDQCEHLKKSLKTFKEENIKLKLSKCRFGYTEVIYLGHKISKNKVEPLINHVESITNLPAPQNVYELQRFLGKINYHRRFIPNMTELLEPLHKLLHKETTFEWTKSCEEAFSKCKAILTSQPALAVFDPKKDCTLYVDASGIGIGCVFKQTQEDGSERPVSYFSRKLLPYQKNYCATEKECLAIVESIDHYHNYLFDKQFTVVSDHDSLRYLLKIKNKNARLLKWSIRLNGYRFDIIYRKGSLNEEADCLSRAPIDKYCQLEEEETRNFINYLSILLNKDELVREQRSLILRESPNLEVINEIFTEKKFENNKILVPEILHRTLMSRVHDEFIHPGIDQTLMILRPNYKFVDGNVKELVENFVQNCTVCIQNKTRYDRALGFLAKIGPAKETFDFISIDTASGFRKTPDSPGAKYMHIAIDHLTRYVWAIYKETTKADDILELIKLVQQDGKPRRILSDNHKCLFNSKVTRYMSKHKITPVLVPPDSAASNGMIERVNQTLTNKIRCA